MTDHNVWPEAGTRLLLRAALLDGDAAAAAYDEWLARFAPASAAELDSPDRRLLPLVASRLGSLGDRRFFADAAELRRKAESRNAMLLAGAREALVALRGAGVAVLGLKGLPLLLEHYRESGLRPMSDIDLMVRPADLERALRALRGAGWVDRAVPASLRPWLCAVECDRPDGTSLDLHQYLIEYGSSPEVEDGLWRRAHEIEVGGERCLAPSPADLLLHVCVASLKFGHHRNSRWIADAHFILRGSAPVDWDVLCADARRRRIELPLRECLQFLVDEIGAPVPARVLDVLWAAPVDRAQRLRYRVLTRNPTSWPELAEEYWSRYSFGARASGRPRTPLGFADFVSLMVTHRWKLPSRWQLPGAVVAKLVAKR